MCTLIAATSVQQCGPLHFPRAVQVIESTVLIKEEDFKDVGCLEISDFYDRLERNRLSRLEVRVCGPWSWSRLRASGLPLTARCACVGSFPTSPPPSPPCSRLVASSRSSPIVFPLPLSLIRVYSPPSITCLAPCRFCLLMSLW
jgi:hypothetical protein